MKRRLSCFGLALSLGVAVGGCTVGPNYQSPETSLPDQFEAVDFGAPTTRPATATSAPAVDLAHWWSALGDPMLDQIVTDAIHENLDVQIAIARLQEARAAEISITGNGIPGIGQTPGVGFSGAAGRTSGNNATKGRVAPALNAASDTSGLSEITELVGFDAGWEIDFFGRYRRMVESAQADTNAIAEAQRQALISVIADVVRTYIDLRTAQYRLDVAKQNVATQLRTLDLVRARLKRGLTNELDVALAERQYAASLAKIAPLQSAAVAARRRVSVLMGKMPEEMQKQLDAVAALPSPPPGVAPGMPVDLLRRRPDIRQAERNLAAANARIGVATADLFPRVALTGGVGWQQQDLGQAPTLGKFVYSVGPSLYWPVLDFGRLDATVQAQDFHTQQILLAYRKTVIGAVEEVDNALSNYQAERTRVAQLADAVAASQRAATLASQRYTTGLTDFLNVLDAQRQLFDLQDQYATAQQSLLWQFVALYKALGGGWQGFETPPLPRMPQPAVIAAVRSLGEHREHPDTAHP